MDNLRQIIESIAQKEEDSFMGEEIAIDPEEFGFLLYNGGFLTQINKPYNDRYHEHKLKLDVPNEGIYYFKTLTISFWGDELR